MTTYQGLDVLDFLTPDRGDGIDHEFLRPQDVVANPMGRERYRAKFEGSRLGWSFRWHATTRAEKRTLREWIDDHRGRAIPFWVPSYSRDLVVHEGASIGAEAIKIEKVEYTRQVFNNGNQRRHLAIWEDGIVPSQFRGVTTAVETSSYDQVGIDDPLAVAITTGTYLSWLLLVRLAEDEIDIEHHGPTYAVADVPLIELPDEYPTPV